MKETICATHFRDVASVACVHHAKEAGRHKKNDAKKAWREQIWSVGVNMRGRGIIGVSFVFLLSLFGRVHLDQQFLEVVPKSTGTLRRPAKYQTTLQKLAQLRLITDLNQNLLQLWNYARIS